MLFLPVQEKSTREPSSRTNMEGFPITLLVAAGVGAFLFTFIAGFFVYANTQSLVSAKDWVEHTQEVLTSLQTASQLTDRIEFTTRLYAFNKDEAQLNTARLSAIGLQTTALHIRTLVADNINQKRNAVNLATCATSLNSDMRGAVIGVPMNDLLRCREAVSLMVEQERGLLKQRTEKFQHSSVVSLTTEYAFVVSSLLILGVLFSSLLRDTLLRRRIAQQAAVTNQNLARSVCALEERIHEARVLTSCRDELQLCVTVQQVYRAAADCMARLLPRSSGSLSVISNSRNLVESVSAWGAGQAVDPPIGIPRVAETFSPDACCALRIGQLRWRRPGLSEIECTHFAGPAPSRYLCIPIIAQGETLGILSIECVEHAACTAIEARMDGLLQLLQLTGMAIASLNLRTKLENQSIRDSLTGLFNRYFLQITLTRELARAVRQQTTLAVFMLDVDHFKHFNDTYGHGAGDAMLQSIAVVFRTSVRTEDTVCRYGGEEFAILLPGVTREVASQRAELIRRSVSQLRVALEDAPPGQATVSLGIAFYPNDAPEGELLLRKADQALYRAKHNGRNQVAFFDAFSHV